MLIVTDINGNTEALTGYKGLKRYRKVSAERTISFTLLPTVQNSQSFDMVQEESILTFSGETYRIKQVSEKSRGPIYYKEVTAIHTFYDIIDDYVYQVQSGSMTFQAALSFVFSGTNYTWDIVDTFYAQDWDNLGDDNRLSLFQKVIAQYGAEYTLSGTHLTFKQQVGNNTDFQFRYNYNVKTISRDVNTNNLSTYIKGYGKKNSDGTYVVQSDYTSPNASIFGIRHAKPIQDDRYTTMDGLNAALKVALNDTPDVSITVDFVDLRLAGYLYDVPNEGDNVFLIYEPMGLTLETRIIDITEEYSEFNQYPLRTSVTIANYRNRFVQSIAQQQKDYSQTKQQVDSAIDSSGKVYYNALDDAVKTVTSAIQSAQTVLEFNNGIIGRDPNNPNHLVMFTSNGIGISTDGGNTFTEAITSSGFALSAGAIGQLNANNIQIGAGTTFDSGYSPSDVESSAASTAETNVKTDLNMTAPLPTSLTLNQDGITASTTGDPTKYARLDYRGLFINNGAVQIQRKDGFNLIVDGVAQFDFGIDAHEPPFQDNTMVSVSGWSYKTLQTSYVDINFYNYRHSARYLRLQIQVGSDSGGQNKIAIFDGDGSTKLYENINGLYYPSGGGLLDITIDLGTPTGNLKSFYIRMCSGASGVATYCRILRKWLEG